MADAYNHTPILPSGVLVLSRAEAVNLGGRWFRKELVPADETFVHPETGRRLRWSEAELRAIAASSNAWALAQQERVPFPDGHRFDASVNLGYWRSFAVEPGSDGKVWLKGLVEAGTDEIAAKLGTTIRDVSAYIEPEAKDSKGVAYRNVITHVAATPYPVIHSGNFEPATQLGDGRRIEQKPMYVALALASPPMEEKSMKKVLAALGLKEDATEDEAEKKCKEMSARIKQLSIDAPHEETKRLAVEKEAAEKQVSALSARVVELEAREKARSDFDREAMIRDAEKAGPLDADTKALAVELWNAGKPDRARHVISLAAAKHASASTALARGKEAPRPANADAEAKKAAVASIALGLSSHGIAVEVSQDGLAYKVPGNPAWQTLSA